MQDIKRSDFHFELSEKSIAKYPLEDRDASKLLVYRDEAMEISSFKHLKDFLTADDMLILNNAKVIPARLYFKRETGAVIEVLLLEPILPGNYEEVFNSKTAVRWQCIIGNLKKWKDYETVFLEAESGTVEARIVDRAERVVEIQWAWDEVFLDVLESIGRLPIPPYLARDTEDSDYTDYQTVFAKNEGSVAAPTAGLHFTDDVLEGLETMGVKQTELTLHVGAGTFLPVKEDNVVDHPMHREFFEIGLEQLKSIASATRRIAVGTTSLRVLESLYYCGVQMSIGMPGTSVNKLEPYEVDAAISYPEALQYVINHLERNEQQTFYGWTEIMILPEYKPKSITALLTNFHLPESTLLMLISSVVGEHWRSIYEHALSNDFRFLSYGDSSLLFVS